jgi:dTDP-4-amino-4,6-dideoxygalactose transaminase
MNFDKKNKIDFFNFSKLLKNINIDLIRDLERCLDHGNFILGDEVVSFEDKFSKKLNSKFSVGLSNGTDAILATLMALNLPSGSEVIVPAFTFIASASVIVRAGLKPIFVDIEDKKFSTSLRLIKEKCNSNTSAIIFVHLFGEYNNLDDLSIFCKNRKIALIEDCAQTYGAKNGQSGIAGTFSFFPAKNLGCLGDGGAVITDDEELYNNLLKIRKHGMTSKYQYEMLGGNFRLDALQAAFLKTIINAADGWIVKRKRNANIYFDLLNNIEEIIMPNNSCKNSFNQFTIRAKDRDKLKEYLKSKGVASNVYYPSPLYKNSVFKKFNKKYFLANTEKTCKEVLSLPIYPEINEVEIEYISNCIKEFYIKKSKY